MATPTAVLTIRMNLTNSFRPLGGGSRVDSCFRSHGRRWREVEMAARRGAAAGRASAPDAFDVGGEREERRGVQQELRLGGGEVNRSSRSGDGASALKSHGTACSTQKWMLASINTR